LGYQVDRQKPQPHRLVGLLKDGSDGERSLMMAAVALKSLAPGNHAIGIISTFWADEPFRPTDLEQVIPTLLRVLITLKELGQAQAGLEFGSDFWAW
jgi:hypothetical protein